MGVEVVVRVGVEDARHTPGVRDYDDAHCGGEWQFMNVEWSLAGVYVKWTRRPPPPAPLRVTSSVCCWRVWLTHSTPRRWTRTAWRLRCLSRSHPWPIRRARCFIHLNVGPTAWHDSEAAPSVLKVWAALAQRVLTQFSVTQYMRGEHKVGPLSFWHLSTKCASWTRKQGKLFCESM